MQFHRFTQASLAALALAGALGAAQAAHRQDAPVVMPEGFASEAAEAKVKACPIGFSRIGTNLCMTGGLGPDSFANAMAVCQSLGGSVANYGAWRYRVLFGDGVGAPLGWWLGPITADDRALFVNSTDTGNFDGETSRFEVRTYACSRG
jgi:hypothetical protein